MAGADTLKKSTVRWSDSAIISWMDGIRGETNDSDLSLSLTESQIPGNMDVPLSSDAPPSLLGTRFKVSQPGLGGQHRIDDEREAQQSQQPQQLRKCNQQSRQSKHNRKHLERSTSADGGDEIDKTLTPTRIVPCEQNEKVVNTQSEPSNEVFRYPHAVHLALSMLQEDLPPMTGVTSTNSDEHVAARNVAQTVNDQPLSAKGTGICGPAEAPLKCSLINRIKDTASQCSKSPNSPSSTQVMAKQSVPQGTRADVTDFVHYFASSSSEYPDVSSSTLGPAVIALRNLDLSVGPTSRQLQTLHVSSRHPSGDWVDINIPHTLITKEYATCTVPLDGSSEQLATQSELVVRRALTNAFFPIPCQEGRQVKQDQHFSSPQMPSQSQWFEANLDILQPSGPKSQLVNSNYRTGQAQNVPMDDGQYGQGPPTNFQHTVRQKHPPLSLATEHLTTLRPPQLKPLPTAPRIVRAPNGLIQQTINVLVTSQIASSETILPIFHPRIPEIDPDALTISRDLSSTINGIKSDHYRPPQLRGDSSALLATSSKPREFSDANSTEKKLCDDSARVEQKVKDKQLSRAVSGDIFNASHVAQSGSPYMTRTGPSVSPPRVDNFPCPVSQWKKKTRPDGHEPDREIGRPSWRK